MAHFIILYTSMPTARHRHPGQGCPSSFRVTANRQAERLLKGTSVRAALWKDSYSLLKRFPEI